MYRKMKVAPAIIICLCAITNLLGQDIKVKVRKPTLDSNSINNWVDLTWSKATISNDGLYFSYDLNYPLGNSVIVIQEFTGLWKKELVQVNAGFFSSDSKRFVFSRKDTLFLLQLGTDHYDYVPNVSSFKVPTNGSKAWIAYQVRDSNQTLVVKDLNKSTEQKFSSVNGYEFSDAGDILVYKFRDINGAITRNKLHWFDLTSGEVFNIWSGDGSESIVGGFRIKKEGNHLVFLVQGDDVYDNSIWYFRSGLKKALMKVSGKSSNLPRNLFISQSLPNFSSDGDFIFFSLSHIPDTRQANPAQPQLDIWNYKDDVLQYTQLYHLSGGSTYYTEKKNFTAVIPTRGDIIQYIEQNETTIQPVLTKHNRYLVTGKKKYTGDRYWIKESTDYYLVSIKDGAAKKLGTGWWTAFSFSPSGKYLVWYDEKMRNYYCYDLLSGEVKNISSKVSAPIVNEIYNEITKDNPIPVGIGGWLEMDKLLLYDNYDIWKVDLSTPSKPRNITNGYGRSKGIKFRLVNEPNESTSLSSSDTVLLTAFNTKTKNNGFFYVIPEIDNSLRMLTLGPYTYYMIVGSQIPYGIGGNWMMPLKANGAGGWILKRQSTNEAPNFIFTTDFRRFRALTNVQPQNKWNWINSELINWKLSDDSTAQGILYKPEDF